MAEEEVLSSDCLYKVIKSDFLYALAKWENFRHIVFQSAFFGQEAEVCYCDSRMGKWGKWAIVIKNPSGFH